MAEDSVLVKLGANIDGFVSGMSTATSKMESSTLRMSTSLGGLGDAIERVRVPFVALIGVMAGAAIFKDVVSGTADAAVQLDILAQKTGLAVKELSQLQYAARITDVDTTTLGMAFQHLATAIQEGAVEPTDISALAFKALGVNLRDAQGHLQPFSALLPELADKFSRMADGTGKLALGSAIFGRNFGQLLPLLNQGSAGLKALASEADALGFTMSEQQEGSLLQYHDATVQLGAALDGVKRTLTVDLAPALTAMAGLLTTVGANTDHVAGSLGELGRLLAATTYLVFRAYQGLVGFAKVLGIVWTTITQGVRAGIQATKDAADSLDKLNDRLSNIMTRMEIGFHPKPPAGAKLAAPAIPMQERGPKATDPLAAFNELMLKNQKAAERFNDTIDVMFRNLETKASTSGMRTLGAQIQENQRLAIAWATQSVTALVASLQKQQEAQRRVAQEMREQWVSAFSAIQSAGVNAFRAVALGQMTAHAAMRNAILSLERDVIASEARKEEAKLAAWLVSKNITITGALQEIGAYAATAAAGAWAALASIPYIGPFVAPAAAAAALAGVIALGSHIASAEGGYDIPAGVNPITQLHAQEMVLPASYANVIRGMAGGGGGGQHIHQWNVSTMDSKSFADHMMNNRDALRAPIKRLLQEGKL